VTREPKFAAGRELLSASNRERNREVEEGKDAEEIEAERQWQVARKEREW
jgi:hypothetical protein